MQTKRPTIKRSSVKKLRINHTVLLLLVIFLASVVRFYNFGNRITFGPEQAISLISSGNLVQKQFTLLGIPNVQRFLSSGHQLYSGALFSYSLVPLQAIFSYNPVPITAYFTLLNILTGILLYVLVKSVSNCKVALLSLTIFLFNDYMIYHSLFIWILNYLPLIGLITAYCLYKYWTKPAEKLVLILGILSGIGIGLEYFYIFSAAVVFVLLLVKMNRKFISGIYYVVGIGVGNLPMFLFDIRHDFYHARTLLQYLIETLANPSQSKISYYHFLNYWPIIIFFLSLLLIKLWKRNKVLLLSLIFGFLCLNIFSKRVDFQKPVGMTDGLNYKKVRVAAEEIYKDNPQKYNVAVLLDFDTRGHILRYLLEFIHKTNPMGVEEYPKSENLYVLSNKDYDFENPKVWELQVIKPYEVDALSDLGESFFLFKVARTMK